MRSLFVMDPLDRINVRGDSTYVTMRECCDRGFPVSYCTPDDLFAKDGIGWARATDVQVTAAAPHFHPSTVEDRRLGEFDVVWMRKDPPFDMAYIFATYLLEMVPRTTLVVNDPVSLKRFNEKLWAMQFPFHPPTLLTRDLARARAFVETEPGKVVIKPWDGNGGRGVIVTEKGDRNLGSLLELLTQEGRQHVIVQRYLPAIAQGDKRILLFDGDPVGAILRVPGVKDHRGNMHAGAGVERTTLSDVEQDICATLGPHLRAHGLLFVGIDVIGGNLTEINVTSPTGIQEVNRLEGRRLEADLVDRVLARHARRLEAE